jgi:hypothetical protein
MTLTEAAFWTKRFGVIALAMLGIFGIVVIILTTTTKKNVLPQYISANYACTEQKEEFLSSKLTIPSLKLATGSDMYFELQTDSGKIDALPSIINVYKFDNPVQSLSSQANAKILANKLGFTAEKITRNGTESYSWSDTNRTLIVLSKNLNFTMKTNTTYIKKIAATGTTPSEQEAKSIAVNFLRSIGFTTSDYSNGTPTTTLININPDGSYSEAASLSEAELVRVDFNRNKSMITIPSNIVGASTMVESFKKKLGEPSTESMIVNDARLDIYTFNTAVTFLNTSKSNISVYIGVAADKNNKYLSSIYQIDYAYWPIQETACGTYELINPNIAIERIQAGDGSLVYLNDTKGDTVVDYTPRSVKKFTILYVNLTYFESASEQQYLQPVYVISGEVIFNNDTKGEFDFYYPAIDYDNVQNKIVQPEPEVVEKKGLL